MLAPLLLLGLLVPAHQPAAAPTPPSMEQSPLLRPAAMSAADMATLHKQLVDKIERMDARSEGIFNEDVTGMVAPYFPPGQPFAVTAATLREQDIGRLQPFKGKTGPDDHTMFVSSFDLMSHTFAHVFVVLHFAFRRAPGDVMVLDHMRAFLRSQAM